VTAVLMLSTSSTRSNPKALAGIRIAVPAYVFVTHETGMSKVVFRLDGTLMRTETANPWDFAGTQANGRAYLFDFPKKLTNGAHTITASVTRNGATYLVTAPFTILGGIPVNAAPAPPTVLGPHVDIPTPTVSTPTPPPATVLTVTSPYVVSHTPYVQDMCYTASG